MQKIQTKLFLVDPKIKPLKINLTDAFYPLLLPTTIFVLILSAKVNTYNKNKTFMGKNVTRLFRISQTLRDVAFVYKINTADC